MNQKSMEHKERCCSISIECDHDLPLPPLPKMASSNRPSTITTNTHRTDFDGLSEKYWGEILERTLSSNSLHALQQTYGAQNHHHYNNHFSTSSNNHHHNNLLSNNTYSDINLNKSETNLYYSNSEPRLCEHDLHDINCAKNTQFFGAFNKIEDI